MFKLCLTNKQHDLQFNWLFLLSNWDLKESYNYVMERQTIILTSFMRHEDFEYFTLTHLRNPCVDFTADTVFYWLPLSRPAQGGWNIRPQGRISNLDWRSTSWARPPVDLEIPSHRTFFILQDSCLSRDSGILSAFIFARQRACEDLFLRETATLDFLKRIHFFTFKSFYRTYFDFCF